VNGLGSPGSGTDNEFVHALSRNIRLWLLQDELRLAANIVGFSFHALEALGQAATPEMPMTRILRLRSSAVSLSREIP
jgi:hypothetical protein